MRCANVTVFSGTTLIVFPEREISSNGCDPGTFPPGRNAERFPRG
jgi:hypothetical protein